MRIQNDWQPVGQPIAAALGSFDGLHRGHCAVVEKVLDRIGDYVYSTDDEDIEQVIAKKASKQDLDEIEEYLDEYINEFGGDKTKIMKKNFYVLIPDTKNPYKQIYTAC